MKKTLLLFAIFIFHNSFSQEGIQDILSNARDFDKTVEMAEEYFEVKHGEKTALELTMGEYRDSDFVKYMRWKAFWSERLNPDGTLGDITKFYREDFDKSITSDFDTIQWTNLSYENYMTYQIGLGRTTSIGFHPSDQNTFYVGAAIGGIWKTTDGGQTYTPLGDDLPFLAVSQIVVKADDPDVIYIGLSDHVWYGPPSIGVYKSEDGGETWAATALTFEFDENTRIYWIAADPDDSDHMLVGTEDGLYSTDDGFDSVSLVNSYNTADVKFQPGNSEIVYQGQSNGVFRRSIDGGATFSLISNLGSGSCRIATTSTDPLLVYVRVGEDLRKSTDGGLNFESATTLPENGGILMISPLDGTTLIAGSFEVYASEDDGENFDALTHWLGNAFMELIHVDHRNAFINPLQDNLIYICNDGGVYSLNLDNLNTSEDLFTNLCDGLMITQFYDIAVSQTDEMIIGGGSQDNGNVFRNTNGEWDDYAITGDGMNQEIDPMEENRRYWSYQYGMLNRFQFGSSIDIAPSGQSGNGAWEMPYKVDQLNPNRLICAYDKVYESLNFGNSWVEISGQLSGGSDMEQLAISPSNPNRIYVTRGNKIWAKNLFNNAWEQKTLPQNNISDIEVDPIDFKTVYISAAGYSDGNKVYKSTDSGDNWENISGSLPNVSTGSIESYKMVAGGLFVGTDAGVYYRDDTFDDWQLYGDLPHTRVEDIEIQYSGRLIRIGTHGRGVLEAPVNIGLCSDVADDIDQDGICNEYDVCDDFDDTLLGTDCNDGDPNTFDDFYIDCNTCAGVTFVGLPEEDQELFSLYPNPSTGLITINLNRESDGLIEVYDLRGQKLFSEQINESTITIDLGSYPSTMYIVKISSKDGSKYAHKKVMIE